MIVNQIGIRNFKSFGNNEQVLNLTNEGKLILLVGENGSGKSSLISSIDYTLFNKVAGGARKKWQTLSTIPNRINKELVTRIKFQSNNTDVEVIRGQNPNRLELWENGIENDRAGKTNINEKIEQYVGMDIETFKSFISMSINDFKNFISLSNEEKKLLLDKLFNLETINTLNSILKDVVKDTKQQISILDKEVDTLSDSIQSFKDSITKVKEKKKENFQGELDTLQKDLQIHKSDYTKIDEKLKDIRSKKIKVKKDLENNKEELSTTKNEVNNINKKIELYESGKCGECETDLTDDLHIEIKKSYIEQKQKLSKLGREVQEIFKKNKALYEKIEKVEQEGQKKFNNLDYKISDINDKIKDLKKKLNDTSKSEDIKEFKSSVERLNKKKNDSKQRASDLKSKGIIYKELNKIFGENGVKKMIIKNIIKPINHFVSENLSYMNMPFEVELDETFTATITHFGQKIEHDTLSTGEQKKINIVIVLAYLKLIRTKRAMNILFLDEVFASIDVEGIHDILTLIKKFANDYNINIFLVHHSILSTEYFDRIIRMNKEIFSEIEEVEL